LAAGARSASAGKAAWSGIVIGLTSSGLREEVSPMTMPHDHRSTSPTALGADRFPHESLDCYRVAREVVAFVAQHRRQLHGLPGEAGPQLERACVRALLNTAEAAGRRGPRDRARVFAIARGEACEAAAALDVAELFGALTTAEAAPVRALLVRLGQMLTRLARPT
jgi:four helix bundle protein